MSLVEHRVNGPVMTITLNDQLRRNALSDELVLELDAAIDAANDDPAIRVIIVTNNGTVFCAGGESSRALLAEHSRGGAQRSVLEDPQLIQDLRRAH